MRLIVHDSPEAMATAAAARIATLISAKTGRFTFGLAGGSTPRSTYRRLRDHDIEWRNVDAWLSDERWVPHHHERCNGLMATEALLGHVDAAFHRPKWSDLMSPAEAAAHYEADVRSLHAGAPPDLIVLGLGTDGHTASLFPGTPALNEMERWIVANEVPELADTRLTATYPLLWNARHVVFLAAGDSKAAALRDSFGGETPAGRVGEGNGEVEWHVDRTAAALLS